MLHMNKVMIEKIVALRQMGLKPLEIAKQLNLLDVQQVRNICHSERVTDKYQDMSKDYTSWENKAEQDASIYWKKSGEEMPKDKLTRILVPLLGWDDAIILVKSYGIFNGHPHLKRLLGVVG